MKYFSIFFILMLWQNTITESPASIWVLPETSIPSPFLTRPPMVTPIGIPRSFTGFWVTLESSLAMNSATSALALIRNLTFITSASSIIW